MKSFRKWLNKQPEPAPYYVERPVNGGVKRFAPEQGSNVLVCEFDDNSGFELFVMPSSLHAVPFQALTMQVDLALEQELLAWLEQRRDDRQ